MKKITLLFLTSILLSFTMNAQCDHSITLYDSYGDGWNGNTLDVLIDGVVVLDDITLDDGSAATFSLPGVTDGQLITTVYNDTGLFSYETSYSIFNNVSNVVASADDEDLAEAYTVICVTCNAAIVDSTTIIDNCAVDGTFSIEIEVSDAGDAGTVFNDGVTTYPVVVGTVVVGPYLSGESVTIDSEALETPCSFTVGVFEYTCPPANDDFANATAVACGGNYTGATNEATLDEDDAEDGGGADLDAPNVWFSYTGSGTAEDITIDLCGSSYDSSVLVYTGTSGNLTLVAANDDGGTANCTLGTRSYLTFPSDGSTTYYITVEGYNFTSVGDYDMTITCVTQAVAPANDLCANAEALTISTPTAGTTVGATVNVSDDNPSCENTFATIVDVWYTFEAIADAMTVTTSLGAADQANVAVYENDCSLYDEVEEQSLQIGCSDANAGETLLLTGLTSGTTYLVRVWNDGVAAVSTDRTEGDFTISVDATLSADTLENEAAFTYYPNPVKNTLTLNAQKTIEQVAMYNMLGQEVLRATPNALASDLDMSNLQTGTYFVKVTIANVTETIRVIKQ
ncbi:T9SS type A sorting domain-containing protein [Winogradskyella ludwigii]|uniref:T9SS type A sorting domain-containing protein n=1 Tax=Winogradskyella ludwigii TaxID=2686076 RepID=UPI0015C8325F|nr:T9SS type A sorting domain-containing protein [Winogradskyella ludwigii]